MKTALRHVIWVLALSLGTAEGKVDKKSGEACEYPKSESELKKLLSPEQYRIIRESGTERPFQNAFWNNHEPGIYVDAVSEVALFSSTDKFDSGSGWPSFTKPIDEDRVVEKKDTSHGMERVEVRSSEADSHLGHVFNDGPGPNGLRYCINSGSLKFIPATQLKGTKYEKYLKLFKAKDLAKGKK
ncbi:MAG: peptide-methionine (R)-S-oxide reductase MsrB [Bdellovibrionales bacterium]|nr:peptide-methionine (R)-S-oxide reductase MsrB [Bdellovibrionales bacterium]